MHRILNQEATAGSLALLLSSSGTVFDGPLVLFSTSGAVLGMSTVSTVFHFFSRAVILRAHVEGKREMRELRKRPLRPRRVTESERKQVFHAPLHKRGNKDRHEWQPAFNAHHDDNCANLCAPENENKNSSAQPADRRSSRTLGLRVKTVKIKSSSPPFASP